MKKKHIALGIGGAIGGAVAVKMLTRPTAVYFEDVADEIVHSEHSNFVDVDGMQVHYQEFGDERDPTMILIHGYTASTYVWHRVVEDIAAEGFRVIAIDLIGFGFSDKPKWFDYTIASQARMVLRFMNRLGIGKATVVGSSYGGAVASWLTLNDAERVEKLVLVNAVINDRPMTNPLVKIITTPGVGETVSPFIADSRKFMRFRMQGTFHPANYHLITEERIEALLRPLKSAAGHNSLLMTLKNWDANRIEEDANLINQPTLIVWGDQDNVIPIGNGEKLYDRILNSRFVVLKNCGHVPPEEKPELFTSLLVEFCKDSKGHLEAKEGDDVQLSQV